MWVCSSMAEMKNVLTPEANLVAFDSQAYVMAASNKASV